MSQLLQHFGFTFYPFGRRTPPPALLRHRGFEEALRRLRYTIELEGIAVLLAEPGCGKSLLLGELADQLRAEDAWGVHYFAHATTGPFGLINTLARKTGLTPRRSRSETADALAQHLLDDPQQQLLVIDEAHKLPDASLEDLRLLTIADFDRKSPFLLLMAAQPQLDERLAEPVHQALDQRITTLTRLMPLSQEETRAYLTRRLEAAGAQQPVFDDGAIDALFHAANGVPRKINNLASAALIAAAAQQRRLVSEQDIHDACLDRGRATPAIARP